MLRDLVVWLHDVRKLAPNIWLPVDGTHRRARNGTLRSNQPGLPANYFHRKSSRCSQAFQPLLYDHEQECPAGTRVGSAKVTALIRGTGKHLQNSLSVADDYRGVSSRNPL